MVVRSFSYWTIRKPPIAMNKPYLDSDSKKLKKEKTGSRRNLNTYLIFNDIKEALVISMFLV